MIISLLFLIISVVLGSIIIWCWSEQPFAGPLLGALIATGVTLSANHYFKSQDSKRSKSNFVASLIAEISALHNIIERHKEQYVASGGELVNYHIAEDYFTVFSENASKIGMLPKDISAKVVNAYIETKVFFDTVRAYSNESREILNIDGLLVRMRGAGIENSKDYQGVFTDFCRRHEDAIAKSGEIMNDYLPKILNELKITKEELIKLK
jgi:hypothetical protein